MDDGFEGDPQLLCEHKHDGDVLDLQVRHSWESKLIYQPIIRAKIKNIKVSSTRKLVSSVQLFFLFSSSPIS